MKSLELQNIIDKFRAVKESSPIIFLDYDGTLVPIITEPEKSYPDAELLKLLDAIQEKFQLYIVTGRSLREMNTFIGQKYNVIALHGAVISFTSGEKKTVEGYEVYRGKCDKIFDLAKEFRAKYPGVHLMNKDGGVVFTKWHVEPKLHHELDEEVCEIASRIGMSCYIGKMIVEIRIPGPNKGEAIKGIRNGKPALIAGDDATDEDAFLSNHDAFTVKIGEGESIAKYRLKDYLEFRKFLKALQA